MAKENIVLKEKTLNELKRLSTKRLKEVEDFISYLRVKEELEATEEIIRDKDLVEAIKRGEEDFKAGRYKSWKAVRKDV